MNGRHILRDVARMAAFDAIPLIFPERESASSRADRNNDVDCIHYFLLFVVAILWLVFRENSLTFSYFIHRKMISELFFHVIASNGAAPVIWDFFCSNAEIVLIARLEGKKKK
jgi:hypothetical protein